MAMLTGGIVVAPLAAEAQPLCVRMSETASTPEITVEGETG